LERQIAFAIDLLHYSMEVKFYLQFIFYLLPPDSLTKRFTGMVIPAHWNVRVICDPKKDTVLTRSSYIYITGPCPKGMKIPEPEEEIKEDMDQEE